MSLRLPPLTAVGPQLYLALQKIARTPTARLAVGYKIVPRRETCFDRCERAACSAARRDLYPGAAPWLTWVAQNPIDDENLRPPGSAIYRDFLLAAGNTGDLLPLANRRLEAARDGARCVDIMA